MYPATYPDIYLSVYGCTIPVSFTREDDIQGREMNLALSGHL